MMMHGGAIEAGTTGEGDAGTLTVKAGNATLADGPQIVNGINDTSVGGTGTGSLAV